MHGWQLHLHRYNAFEGATLRLGSYAVSSDDPDGLHYIKADNMAVADNDIYNVALQPLAGFDALALHRLPNAEEPRRHIYAKFSYTVTCSAAVEAGRGVLIALSYIDKVENNLRPWEIAKREAGSWTLEHPDLGTWEIHHPELPG
jgi:hypothetical protein